MCKAGQGIKAINGMHEEDISTMAGARKYNFFRKKEGDFRRKYLDPWIAMYFEQALPCLESLTIWTTLNAFPPGFTTSSHLSQLTSLRLGGLSFPLFLRDSLASMGSQLGSLELQSVHFAVELDLIGRSCPRLQVSGPDWSELGSHPQQSILSAS